MKTIKEVNVFTHGDSARISTWSNVPYFFTETLLAKGIKVNRIDISPHPLAEKFFDNLVWRVLNKLTFKHHFYTYMRTRIHHFHVRRKIRNAVAQYPDADVNIFLTFSNTAAGISGKPSILFCDFTIDYYFKNILKREPDLLENAALKRQEKEIEKADLILCLFPMATDYMKERYRNRNIFYLGNVVNSVISISADEAVRKKEVSRSLLFIGSRVYYEGAKTLLAAFPSLRKRYPGLTLDIIGMKEKDFTELPEGVTCHGYLDKAKDADRERYYSLMKNARILVNTTPKWGAFSSTIEAMYFYTPVITSSYPEFELTFGKEIPFGLYCNENTPEKVEASIISIMDAPHYGELCLHAHAAVKDYTWDAYIDKVLDKVRAIL